MSCGRLAGLLWLCRKRGGELAAGADAERGEHFPQVVGHGGRADEQLRGDLGVGGTPAGQPGDVSFPCGQDISRLRGAFGSALARGAQLDPGPLGERPGAGGDEDLVRGAELIAGLTATALAAQPLAIEQVGAGQLDAQARASEAVDRLAVKILRGLTAGQQCARARLGPQRPVGTCGAGGLSQLAEGLGRAVRLPGPGRCFDQLGQDEGGPQLLRVLAGLLRRGQRLLVPAEAVVEYRAGPVDAGQRQSLAPAPRFRQAALDQGRGCGFVALPGGNLEGSIGLEMELASSRIVDLLRFLDQCRGSRGIASPGDQGRKRDESDGQRPRACRSRPWTTTACGISSAKPTTPCSTPAWAWAPSWLAPAR